MALCDMFLAMESARSGVVRGESTDTAHSGEINLLDWSWGMSGAVGLGGAGTAQRGSLSELRLVKRADSATTALMAIMRTNDLIRSATVTVRKAGTKPIDYLIIKIGKGRITSFEIGSNSAAGPELEERLSIAFETINVDYCQQDATGAALGGSSFNTEIG